MTKLYLKYEFNFPGDEYDYGNLVRAQKYRSLLSEIFRTFRLKSDHGDSGDTWAEAYSALWEMAKDRGLDPWEEIF